MSYGPPPGFGFRMMGPPPPAGSFNAPPPSQPHLSAPPISNPPVMIPSGPAVTVFVGNITERASDGMVRHLLTSCGAVVSWKRVQGATGRLQAFGFCEYAGPEFAARAIRMLHNRMVGDKKLVVKVDAKAAEVLEDYKRQCLGMPPKEKGKEEEPVKDEQFLNPTLRRQDQDAEKRITAILEDHKEEMANYQPPEKRYPRPGDANYNPHHQTGPKESLDDVDLEDGKREVINAEIVKFRETMKKREAEKEEAERKRKEEEEREAERERERKKRDEEKDKEREAQRNSESGPKSSRERSSRRRSPSPRSPRPRSRSRSRSRRRESPPPHRRERGGFGSRGGSARPDIEVLEVRREERSRSRGFGDRRGSSRVRSRSRSPPRRRSRERGNSALTWRDREKEEEDYEQRKAEKRAREKEAAYQERLRKWESREAKMAKEQEKEAAKETKKTSDMEREARKLRSFLEDYDDDRDDPKYYKGRELERRLHDREREAAKDAEDRQREKEELEELKAQIRKEGFDDPEAELQRRQMIEEAQKNSMRLAQQQGTFDQPISLDLANGRGGTTHENIVAAPPAEEAHLPEPTHSEEPPQEEYSQVQNSAEDEISHEAPPPPMDPEVSLPSKSASPTSKITLQPIKNSAQISRRKLEVKDVFNTDDDDMTPAKRRKTLPGHDHKKKETSTPAGTGPSSAEEKRKHIKNLVDQIPTDKKALFEYKVEWELVDKALMERRIRPWINKKITEYIGEPEPTLTEFICSKVQAGSSPTEVLEDVQMVLDEEAEVFIVKMWRLLIYEILNKKHKATLGTQA